MTYVDPSDSYVAGYSPILEDITGINMGWTRSGYTFAGWNTAADGSGTTYGTVTTPMQLPALADDVDLYAQWEKVTKHSSDSGKVPTKYTLTLDTSGGTAVPSVSRSSGSVVNLPQTTSKGGYTFEGWYSDAERTNMVASVTLNRNMTVYAKWSATEVPDMFREDHVTYIVGYPDGNVHTEANITRGETATIFFRLC